MIERLLKKIESGKAVVGVVGLGYVGLPLAREFTRSGARTLGFDIDAAKVKLLLSGRSYIEHVPAGSVREMVRSGRIGNLYSL